MIRSFFKKTLLHLVVVVKKLAAVKKSTTVAAQTSTQSILTKTASLQFTPPQGNVIKRGTVVGDNVKTFRAVKVVCDKNQACDNAQRTAEQVFLCSDAPWLPLKDCSHRDACQCHYLHLDDRRLSLRRDADHGLPSRDVECDRRRFLNDRRQA
jgi:hypothetical protein